MSHSNLHFKFQFHKGTSKTLMLPVFCKEVTPFQFHKGTSKTPQC